MSGGELSILLYLFAIVLYSKTHEYELNINKPKNKKTIL